MGGDIDGVFKRQNNGGGRGGALQKFQFLLTFFVDIITPVISSTQIVCDVMCVQSCDPLVFT